LPNSADQHLAREANAVQRLKAIEQKKLASPHARALHAVRIPSKTH
jgi:hypothetical protein